MLRIQYDIFMNREKRNDIPDFGTSVPYFILYLFGRCNVTMFFAVVCHTR